MIRHGATEQVALGARAFFGPGILGDVKWNVLPRARRTALTISGGAGVAYEFGPHTILSVPITLSASHDIAPRLTPYAAVGNGAYWIFGYGDPGASNAPRSGTGDGLLGLHAGVELRRASGLALLLEYSYSPSIVDDPGDRNQFSVTQFVSIGFHTGGSR